MGKLSKTTARRELIALRMDPTSGITTKGRATAKVYVKAKDDVSWGNRSGTTKKVQGSKAESPLIYIQELYE